MKNKLFIVLLLLAGSAFGQAPRRGAITTVRDGRVVVDTLRRDTLPADSLIGRDTAVLAPVRKPREKDTISLTGTVWLGVIAPGFGQIYNKQYWKVPVLYAATGASLTMFLKENNRYRPLKRQFDALELKIAAADDADKLALRHERDAVQQSLIRVNTRRQIWLGATAASYLYFLGDAAVNYAYKDDPVRKATTLAWIFPGAGQIYNKSYWKLPFVIGGLATTIFVADWNNRGYQRYKKAYALRADWDRRNAAHQQDPDNNPEPGPMLDEFAGRSTSTDDLRDLRNQFRRSRDLSLIITAGIYLLQVMDAHVDAHLKNYDISDDLSMRITPALGYTYSASARGVAPTLGVNLSLTF